MERKRARVRMRRFLPFCSVIAAVVYGCAGGGSSTSGFAGDDAGGGGSDAGMSTDATSPGDSEAGMP